MDPKQLKLALAYKEYEKACEKDGVLDFDSLEFHMVEILTKNSEVRVRWIRDWLQIDEAQDLSKIEWDLAKLISGKSVLAVGDTSQGIYGFRGSGSKLFANMSEMFPETQTLYLGHNYRSTPQILDFIKPYAASRDLAQKFHTHNPKGPVPEIKGFLSPDQEVAWVVSKIRGLEKPITQSLEDLCQT